MKSLFLTAFAQVYLVAVNTVFLAKSFYLGVFAASFLISLIWSFNVKRVAFGTLRDRLIYALGAAFGGLSGLITAAEMLTQFFK